MSHRLLSTVTLRSTRQLVDRLQANGTIVRRSFAISTEANASVLDKSLFNDALQPENLVNVISRLEYLKQMNLKRRRKDSSSEAKRYAVLIPFCFDCDGDASILFTLRSRRLRRSGYQLSFPGGLQDSTDNDDITETALRETEEEIALPRNRVNVIGHLPPLTFFLGADTIHPIISLIDLKGVTLQPNPDEVESIHLAKLKHLVIDDNWRYTRWKAGWALPCYRDATFNDKTVPRLWGLTATITHLVLRAMFPSIHHFQFDLMEAPYTVKRK